MIQYNLEEYNARNHIVIVHFVTSIFYYVVLLILLKPKF